MRITLYGALPEHGAPNSRHPQHRKVIPMRATQLMAVAAALLFSTNLAFAQAQPQQRPTGAAAPPAATAPVSRSAAPAAGQYKTEADAKSHCGSQEVVWLNTASNVY